MTLIRPLRFSILLAVLFVLALPCRGQSPATEKVSTLDDGFSAPPPSARLRCYWWWLNGHTTKETITSDLTEMKRKGYGGVLLVDADGGGQEGNDNVPAGPEFGSPAWVELFLHALHTARDLDLEVTLNLTSGWNLGGPWVQPEQATKLLTWSRITITAGEQAAAVKLTPPPAKNAFYKQIAVLAYPLSHGPALPGETGSDRRALPDLALKSAAMEGGFSMPDLSGLLREAQNDRDQDAMIGDVRDITSMVDPDGTVHWTPPAASAAAWELLRIGYTSSDARVSTSSGAWQGLVIDYLDPAALDQYWDRTIMPLLDSAKPYLGTTLKFVTTDSWELGGVNWTKNFSDVFKQRRGYDPVPYLPIVAGRILGSRDLNDRFLADLRRTVADLVDTHYARLAELSAKSGLGTQVESGGPHAAPIDALETFKRSAIPQTEFWAKSTQHRSGDQERFFVKEAASAAHIYGRPLIAAEGMTSIGNQWSESLGTNLKPTFDQALTEGLNRLVWHAFTSSPKEMGVPGQEYFAGTHLNPQVTWWPYAGAFTLYLNRAQFLMQQGQPVADVLYYYGDNVPNFVRLKQDDPSGALPGYDYDVISTDALLERTSLDSGALHTPEGVRYRVLALPRSHILPLPVLEAAATYTEAGGTLVGSRPLRAQGLSSAVEARKFDAITDRIWTDCERSKDHHSKIGRGEIFCIDNARDALRSMKVDSDFETTQPASLDYIHRRDGECDIYFIRNTQPARVQATVTLRVSGKQPEIFNAVTGEMSETLLYRFTADHRTVMPISLESYGSLFIVLRRAPHASSVASISRDGLVFYKAVDLEHAQFPAEFTVASKGASTVVATQTAGSYEVVFTNGVRAPFTVSKAASLPGIGAWTLNFPTGWGAPPTVALDQLQSWSKFSDPGVRYFSGTATYRTTLTASADQLDPSRPVWLDLGDVREIASVRINHKDGRVLWKDPYSVRIDDLLHAGENTVEVEVTNLWPNRLIGDAQSISGKHYTWTNIRKYTKDSPLLPSGMLGPVALRQSFEVYLKSTNASTEAKNREHESPQTDSIAK